MRLRAGFVAFVLVVAIEIAFGIAIQIVRFQTIGADTTFTICASTTTTTTAATTAATTTAAAFAIGRIIACCIRCLPVCTGVSATVGMRFGHDDVDRVCRVGFIGGNVRRRRRGGFGDCRHHTSSRRGCCGCGQRLCRSRAFVLTGGALLPLGRRAVLLCRCTRGRGA